MPLEPPVTGMLILRYDRSSLPGNRAAKEAARQPARNKLVSATHRHRVFAFRPGRHGRKDPSDRADAEESLPARITTIGRKMQEALGKEHRPILHAVAGNTLQIEISASRAVGETGKAQRDPPGIKPSVARVAAPGSAPREREHKIHHSRTMRAEAIGAAALRTDHRTTLPDNGRQHNQNRCCRQRPT
jgi:hypothetical protein